MQKVYVAGLFDNFDNKNEIYRKKLYLIEDDEKS